MPPIDREVLAGFVAEAKSYLPEIARGIETFRREPAGSGALDEAYRLVHSIKGASSMVGLAALSHMAFFLEEGLEDLARGELTPSREVFDATLGSLTLIEGYLDGLSKENVSERPFVTELVRLFRRARALPEAGDAADIEQLLSSTAPLELAQAAPALNAPTPPERFGEISPELIESFLDEAEGHVTAVARALGALRSAPAELAPLAAVRRSIHTLKGTAALVNQGAIAQLAHRMEDLLDALVATAQPMPADDLQLLEQTNDALADLVASRGDDLPHAGQIGELYTRYDGRLPATGRSRTADLELPAERPIDVASLLGGAASDTPAGRERATGPVVRVPLERLEELVRLASELVVNRSTFEQHFGGLARQVAELGLSVERLRRIAARLESEYEVAALAGGGHGPWTTFGAGRSASQEFDELELDRYTEFHLRTRELTETGSDISALAGELSTTIGDFDGDLVRLTRITSEVQDGLLQLRMVPLATLAARLERTVRVTAGKQGKAAELVFEGAEVELDKSVIEEIADPLLHLLRNAVDHGIEPPALRRVLGKPERGTVTFHATHEGTHVVIEVKDDGAGIAPETIREAAVAGGFLAPEVAAELGVEDLMALLFQPGFSTAGTVSEISGRGVGLDVVDATIRRMKGTVALTSTPGAGTSIVIRLPVTLAILRVLMVTAGTETYAVPLAVVTQILRLERAEVGLVGADRVITVGGEVLPLLELSRVLGLTQRREEPAERRPVLVVTLGDRKYALAVEGLTEAREVVVKPLGAHLKRLPGLTGATLMGDGSVVLILNPAELLDERTQERPARLRELLPGRRAAAALEVMIVDDSLSVRRVLAGLVRNAGWTPITARDGVEALELVQQRSRHPDAILLDIEMPRMDGYELAATLKAQEALSAIPILMLTSRAGEKHRAKALALGVDGYLVKPFQDSELLAAIRRVLQAARAKVEPPPEVA